MSDRFPEEACPYHRPFSAEFDACPAYRPSRFTGLDLHYRPLPSVWTCSHLEVQRRTAPRRSFYARCRLGGAEERREWVAEVNTRRLEGMRSLSRELTLAVEPAGKAFWELKGRQLRALRTGEDATQATSDLTAAAAALEAVIEGFFDARADLMEQVGLPDEPTKEVIRVALQDLIDRDSTESSFAISDDLLERFPAEVRAFFRPRPAA